jgi:exosome complex component CSL4
MAEKKVLPGEFLSTEEEFIAGKNAVESDGGIYSTVSGSVEADQKTKEISVKAKKPMRALKTGDLVYGRVELVKENSVIITLCELAGKPEQRVIGFGRAMLPIRNVSRDYVEKLSDFFKVGDLVKVRVSKIFKDAIDVESQHPDLGVIKAFCSKCRQPLHKFGPDLRCMKCGSSEQRKLSSEYLLR